MGTLKGCLAKLKKAGYDTSSFPLAEMEVSSDIDSIIESELNGLRNEHTELYTTRRRLMKQLGDLSPEMNGLVEEHKRAESALNQAAVDHEGLAATRKTKIDETPKPKQGPPQQSSTMAEADAQTNKAGLPRKAPEQEPKPLKNLGKTVANERKLISTEEEATAVAGVIQKLRRLQGTGKEYHELSTAYAVKKAQAAGKMEEIRAMFPLATSNIEAMKRFQQIAKNQVEKEKSDDTPVFTDREAKQLGAYNEELIAQRANEKVEGRERESSPDEVLEGATELEPQKAEATIKIYRDKAGKAKEVDGVVGIARRVKNLFPGSTLFRTPSEKHPGLNEYTIRQEVVEEDVHGAPTNELMKAFMKALIDGRRTPVADSKGRPTHKVVEMYDQKTGEKVNVGSISVTKLGAILDQSTQDINMSPTEKSAKQFAAGISFLMTEANLTLEPPPAKKTKKAKKPAEPAPVVPETLDDGSMSDAYIDAMVADEQMNADLAALDAETSAKVAENKKLISARAAKLNKTGDQRITAVLETLSLDTLNAIESVIYMDEAYVKRYPTATGTAELATGIIRLNKDKVYKSEGVTKMAVKHEAGHLVDAELNMQASDEWLTMDMLAEAHSFVGGQSKKMSILFKRVFEKYKPQSWPREIVAQLFYAHHNNPDLLNHQWPRGYALVERMHDELRRKREFIAEREAERSAQSAHGLTGTLRQEEGGGTPRKRPTEVPGDTVIHSSGLTLAEANKKLQASSIRKSKGRGLKKQIAKDTRGPEDAPREEMVTSKEEGLTRSEPDFVREGDPTPQPGLERTVDIVGDDKPDTRQFEKEEAQIARSTGSAQTHPELVGASIPPKAPETPEHADVKRIFDAATQRNALGDVPRKFIGMMNSIFGQLGIQTKVIVVDKKGAKELLKEPGLPVQWKTNLEAVLKDEPAGRLMLSDSNIASERFAIVYVDTAQSRTQQQEAFLHELGHIVQLAKLDQASDEVQSALRDAHKGSASQLEFEEWFANQLIKWVGVNREAKSGLERFFKELAQALKKVWRKFKVDSTYEQFMDSLVAANQLKRGHEKPASGKFRREWIEDMAGSVDSPFLPVSDKSYYNMTREPRSAAPGVKRATERVFTWGKHHASNVLEGAKAGRDAFHSVVTQSADSYLRANGLAWLADHFHKRPDVSVARSSPTIEMQIRIEQGQFEPLMDKIMELMPNNVNRNDPVYKRAVDDLIGQVDNPSPLAREILKYFEAQEKYLHKNNVKFKTRKKYFPIMLDVHQWIMRRDKVVAIAMKDLGKTKEQAEELYRSVAANPNKLFDMSTEYDVRSTASFGHATARTFGPKEHKAFQEFINTDLVSVVKNYTHASAKHVVYKQHFGRTDRADPLTNLKNQLTRAVISGEITQDVYDRTWNTVLPALFGQLGADINPGWRKLQSGAIFYQNVRLLGTAVFANIVDLAGVTYRSGGVRGKWSSFKKALRSMSDKEAQAAFRTLGLIRDDLTESILNDPTHTQFYSPTIKRWNEKFFKWNGMHALTNFSRIYAFTMGKQYVIEKARQGDTKALDELGLTVADVLEWDKNGRMLDNANDTNRRVLYAMHQFTDEAILRPSASQRPAWMSDQRWLLVAHLKQFIYTYYETIIRRVISQAKAGQFKDPAVVLQFAMFFALAMTLSMAGYEMRKQLMHAGDVPAYARGDALDYFVEGIQRAGMLGPLQFAVDSMEAESRGNMALMSLLGPTATQMEQLMTKDLSYSLSRALPGFAQSPALREWVR